MIWDSLTQEQRVLAAALSVTCAIPVLTKAVPNWLARGGNLLRGRRRYFDSKIEVGSVSIPDEARLRHTHIVGATGSGKTVLLEQLIYRDLERGYGAVIIDPKGDRELYHRVKAFCKEIGREGDLKLLSSTHHKESALWNPCRLGSATELQSKFFNSAIYSEPHYAKACELALLKAFNELTETKSGFTLTDLVSCLRSLSRDGKDETMAGLFLDLNNLVLGPWGELLSGDETLPREEIDLLSVTRRGEILFVDLPTEAQAVQSARVGRLLLQEIILVSGLRKLYPHLKTQRPFSVFVDEFDAFAFPAFATFLNKGRSSDFMIHLAHQTLSDLDKITPTFRGQIVGNMNVRFIFRQDDPDDAESWSRFFGTQSTVKRTYQTQDGQQTGMSSNREVLEFKVSPDSIKELQTGECFFGMKSERVFKRFRVPFEKGGARSKFQHPDLRPKLEKNIPTIKSDPLSKTLSKKGRHYESMKEEETHV